MKKIIREQNTKLLRIVRKEIYWWQKMYITLDELLDELELIFQRYLEDKDA